MHINYVKLQLNKMGYIFIIFKYYRYGCSCQLEISQTEQGIELLKIRLQINDGIENIRRVKIVKKCPFPELI